MNQVFCHTALALWISLALIGSAAAATPAKSEITFSRDILPILSDNCFHCHGPDEKERKAKLRLDLHDGALGKGKSGEIAIIPGDASKSEVIRRITSPDEDEVMPPPKSNRKLAPQQIELLRRWV